MSSASGGAGHGDSDVIQASLETSRHRDNAEVSRRLESWLEQRWGKGPAVVDVTLPASSGASSEVFFVRIANAPFAVDETAGDRIRGGGPVPYAAPGGAHGEITEAVLRLSPRYPVYPIVDMGLQYRCMQVAAARSRAPIPKVYACEESSAALGAAFILMERGRGRGAPDWPSYVVEGWIHDLAPVDQRQLWLNGVEAVAAVHATDLSDGSLVDAALPTPGATMLDRMLSYWKLYLSLDSQGGSYPMLETAVEYLHRDRPEVDFEPRLVWGDASLRNMLFDGLRPSALMDFEFAHIGIYAFDIAFYALMDYVMAEGFADRAPRLPGFASIADTLDYYESLTGLPVPHRDYFLRMAVTYMALATTRVYQRLAAEGRFPPAAIATNPSLRTLTEIFTSGRLPP